MVRYKNFTLYFTPDRSIYLLEELLTFLKVSEWETQESGNEVKNKMYSRTILLNELFCFRTIDDRKKIVKILQRIPYTVHRDSYIIGILY